MTAEIMLNMERALYGFAAAVGYSHPIHPPSTHMPIGLILGAFLLGLLSLIFHHEVFGRAARYCAIIALCFSVLTLCIGYLDWRRFFGGGWLIPIEIKMALGGCLFVLLIWALVAGRGGARATGRVVLLYSLSLANVLAIGYFGGQLVYSGRSPAAPVQYRAGEAIFRSNCSGCHPYGGNIADPAFPLRGAPQLKDGPAFLSWIRAPRLANGSRGAMPSFPGSRISDGQTETLRAYVVNVIEGSAQGGEGGPPGAQVAVKTDRASIDKGHVLFEAHCSDCHAAKSAETLVGPGLAGILKRPTLPASGRPATAENVYRQLRQPYRKMPSFAQKLTDEDVANLIAFLNTL